ncbi:MAG: MFS transporter [Chloroflexi bacterium]|nr:MFS transporter [Chloroflexota bacterium]
MLAHLVHHLLTALPVPLLPFIRDDFALDYTQSGVVISAFSLSYGIGQLPAGWLADRIGPRILLTIGICGVALAGLLVGLSQTYILMIVFLALMGIAGGGYHPSAAPLITASVEPKNQGRALGIHLIGGSGSFFLAPLVAAAIAAVWGWRGSFIALAVPTVVFGIIFYLLLGRRVDTGKTRRSVTERADGIPSSPGHLRRLVAFMALSISAQAMIFSTIAFVPLFMVDHFGVGEEAAAVFLAIIYSAGLWASPLGGYLSDRLGKVPVALTACFIAVPAIYSLNLVPYGQGISIGALLLLIGMAMYIRMPVSEAYIVSHTSERRRSTILGIYYFASMETGGILAPVVGSFIDRIGFYSTFTIVSVALLIVTLTASVFLWGNRG